MAIMVNIYYTGKDGNAVKFAKEMTESGIVSQIRAEEGNLKYEYCFLMEDRETVLLIDSWVNQQALDLHHASPMMQNIVDLREKYNLSMMWKDIYWMRQVFPKKTRRSFDVKVLLESYY